MDTHEEHGKDEPERELEDLEVPGEEAEDVASRRLRIEVLDRTYRGYFQTKKYTYQRRAAGALETQVVGPMQIKSEIIRPRTGESVGVGMNRVFGVAWAGEEPVAGVEVSTDGGRSWNPAQLIGPRAAYSWNM